MKGSSVKLHWLIILILIIFIVSISFYISFAEDTPVIIHTTNDTEFAIKASQLKNNDSFDFKSTSNINNRLLITYKSSFDYSELEGLKKGVFGNNACIFQFDTFNNAQIAYDTLKDYRQIKSVEFDQLIQANDIIGNSSFNASAISHNSWGVKAIEIDKYITYIKKNCYKPITIAIIDSGIYSKHSFISSRIDSGWDFVPVEGDDDPTDENGHGTHVAGIVVDCTYGLDKIRLMPVRVLDEQATGWMSDIANGVLYSVDNGAQIINLSLCGTHSEYLDSAINNAIDKNVIVICAAGNDDVDIDKNNVCPAHIQNVITVGAINKDQVVEYYSNYGKKLDVMAPGGRIKSCALKDGQYIIRSGTSMSVPHVSACATLLKMRYPNKNYLQIESVLKRSAIPDTPKIYYGKGTINMENLVDSIVYQKISAKTKSTYTGQQIKPIVTVSRNGEKLFSGEDYTVTYKNNIKIGIASIVIKGKGTYSGSKTLYFKIIPKGTEIKSVKAKKNGFTIKWKKQELKTSGYQIQYATNKNFKKAKNKTIKGKDNISYKLTKLKSKKKYYIRIRTYKTVDGKKYYSFWSKVQSIKTK